MTPTSAAERELPLVRTKLFVPAPPAGRVRRTRLLAHLDREVPLTLVSAPAGFGKTTVVSDWLSACERSAGWLSLDAADSDPRRFLRYLAEALVGVLPTFGNPWAAALRAPQLPPADALVAPLIDALSARDTRPVVVLDDYHLIEDADVHGLVGLLAERLPSTARLVILTRKDPAAGLAAHARSWPPARAERGGPALHKRRNRRLLARDHGAGTGRGADGAPWGPTPKDGSPVCSWRRFRCVRLAMSTRYSTVLPTAIGSCSTT